MSRVPIRRCGIEAIPKLRVVVEAPDDDKVMREWSLKFPPRTTRAEAHRVFEAVCRSGSIDPTHWIAGKAVEV